MKLAGKYGSFGSSKFADFFPNKNKMQALAEQTENTELQLALLDFQEPFKKIDLEQSSYSPEIKQAILQAATQ
jgi:hypothetical protein